MFVNSSPGMKALAIRFQVICAVYGPRQCRVRTPDDLCFINCQFSLSSFATQSRKKAQRSMEAGRLLERTLKSVIDRAAYPRTRVDIFCEIIQVSNCIHHFCNSYLYIYFLG